MPTRGTPKPLLSLRIAVPLAVLALAPAAGATTGIEATVPVTVTITDSGVLFTPAVRKLHPDTDTTYRVRVVNRASRRRSFRIGYRSTRPLAKGAVEDFYITFHAVGRIRWSAGSVKAPGSSGVFDVKLAKAFSGA